MTSVEPQNNVAAAVVPSTDTLIIGGTRIALALDLSKSHRQEPSK